MDYSFLAEHANDVFFLHDAEGRRLYISPSCRRLLGYEPEELAALPRSTFVHPDDAPVVGAKYAELTRGQAEFTSVHRFKRKDGRYIWVEALVRFISPVASGSDAAIVSTVRDITERKLVEDALTESEERFRGSFDTAAHGMALVSPVGRWLRVNSALCRMIGYTEEELLATDFQSVTHADDLDADLARAQAMLAGEIDTYQMEKRYLHKNGKIIWILLSVSLVRSSTGEPLHFVAQIQDITEQKRAEGEASRLHALLVDAIEAMQDGVALYDPEDRLVLINSSLKQYGKGHDDLFTAGRFYEDILRTYWLRGITIPDGLDRLVTTALERHRRGDGFPWEVKNLAGNWYLIRHFRTRDGGILTVSTDITALKEKEVKLQSALVAAEAANIAKQDFLATMSHELRTPLNAIIGFSSIMADQIFGAIENEKYLEFSKDIHRSGQHLLRLINGILEYSKLEADDLHLEQTSVDIAAATHAAIESITPLAESAGVELCCALPNDLPSINIDTKRIRQILDNLLSNAVRFTPSGGTVHLSALATRDGNVAVVVRDNGIGISKEDLPRVFEPFFQVDGSLSRKSQHGVGLGLPLARLLVELCGGSLHLESELGKGTTATVILPGRGDR